MLHVEQMTRLHRGRNFVSPGNNVHDVRLKRYLKDEKKLGSWSWAKNPLVALGNGTASGCRWRSSITGNLKDVNNTVYQTRGEPVEDRYVVVIWERASVRLD